MSLVEGVVGSVNAILKSLECAICLGLLKTPVTAGCGHFFCKICITKVLKSNYRSPCPLCKKPFTRRSIQEAQQRQSIIEAAKELAEACETFTGVKFVSKESCDTKNNSTLKKPTSVQGSSTSKKRKSHESETSDQNIEDLADNANEKSRKSIDSAIEDSNSISTNDEIIPSTNKRHCQSRAESDDELHFPSLEEILKSKPPKSAKRKSDEMRSSKKLSKKSSNELMRRVSDSEINSKLSRKKSLEGDVSVIPDTNASSDVAMSISSRCDEEKPDADIITLDESESEQNIIKPKEKVQVTKRGSKFKSSLSNKKDKIALTNKTNQPNLKKKEAIEKDLENDKHDDKAVELEKNSEELVKENKAMDVELFLSPIKAAQKDNSELSSSPNASRGRKTSRKSLSRLSNKNKKGNCQAENSSIEEEILISKLNKAENYSLIISNVTTKTTPVEGQKNSNEKVRFNLSETTLPPKETELAPKPQKELVRLEEITDTAVSVQNVESPEAAKIDLVMKSPGWSKVKQVGKDFKVRKFSRLHVEKNTSNSCPSEVLAVELDSVSNETATEPVNDEKLSRTSDPISVDYEKRGTFNTEKNEILDSALNVKNKTVKISEPNTCSSTSQKDTVAVGLKVVDDDHCMIEDLNEMPSLINETERNVDYHEISCDDQGRKSPPQAEKPRIKDNKTCDISLESVNQFICKGDVELMDVGNQISSSTILNDYNANVTNLSSCSNNDNILHTNLSVILPVITDENKSIQEHTDVANSVNNFESEFMEVDSIGNIGVNTKDGSHFQNIDINQKKSNYLQLNNFVSSSSVNQENIVDVPKTEQIKEPLFKYQVLDTNVNHDKNICYVEHSQQTSQRLLNYCEKNNLTKSLYPPVSFYPGIVEPNAMIKQNDFPVFNPIERFNANILKPLNTERTKVVKRTCLTLEEIQEAFANSSVSGNPENICSLPFLAGEYKLSVCISEETLNISVLRVVNSDSFPGLHNKSKTLLLSEKCIQTSNNNTPVPSPTAIPSSNVESESSQPMVPEYHEKAVPINQDKPKNLKPFPYLSEYFSDSESTEQMTVGTKEDHLNDSEVFPFIGPVSGSSEARNHCEQNEEMACESAVENVISIAVYNPESVSDNLPVTQPHKEDTENHNNPQDDKEIFCEDEEVSLEKDRLSSADKKKSLICLDVPKADEKFAKLLKEKKAEPLNMTSHDIITEGNDKFTEKATVQKKRISSKSSSKEKTSQISKVLSKSDSKSQKTVKETKFPTCSSNKSTAGTSTSESISYLDAANSKSYEQLFDDSEEFSSDPDMAFAMEMVAPLKNIAEQLKNTENKEKSKEDLSTKGFSFSLKERNPMETFEQLILSKNKDSFQNSSTCQKPSRLSLKSKRSSKKFKRIKTCDSDDDSDASESSKNESTFSTFSKSNTAQGKMDDNPGDTSKYENIKNSSPQSSSKTTSPNDDNLKNSNMPYESLQDNSTLNSISEDMTNNSSDIAMEIEDLDQKILSVVEKLKQCGREDLLNQEKLKLLKCSDKTPTKSCKKDEDCQSSFDSEDSTDIFSQSVPPTPPDATSNNDSGFKTSMYSHK